MKIQPAEMLETIKKYGELSVPQFIALIGITPRELVKSLEQLNELGLVQIRDAAALDELRAFVKEAPALDRAPLLDQRRAFYNYAMRPDSSAHNATVTALQIP